LLSKMINFGAAWRNHFASFKLLLQTDRLKAETRISIFMVAPNASKISNVAQLHEDLRQLSEEAKNVVAACTHTEGSWWPVLSGVAVGAVVGGGVGGVVALGVLAGSAVGALVGAVGVGLAGGVVTLPPKELLLRIKELKSLVDARCEMLTSRDPLPPEEAINYMKTNCPELLDLEQVSRAGRFLDVLDLWVDKWALG